MPSENSREALEELYEPKKWSIDRFKKLIRNSSTVFILLFTAYIGSIFVHAPCLLIAVIWPKKFRQIVDMLILIWLRLAELIIRKWLLVRVRHFGDPISSNQNVSTRLLVLNHRTQLDWFFIWGLGHPIQLMKIVLKEILSLIPGAGWSMQCASFIFLRRRIQVDQKRLETVIPYLKRSNEFCELIIFPEGTDLNKMSLEKSDQYARKNNLPPLRYTLHPRCTGFVSIVNILKSANLEEIYDVTVAYPDFIPSPVEKIFLGYMPKEVHYHVKCYRWKDILNSMENDLKMPKSEDAFDDALANWLKSRWFEKEKFLREYYSKPVHEREFAGEIERQVDSRVFSPFRNIEEPRLNFTGWFIFLFWVFFLYFTIRGIFTNIFVFAYFILVQLVYVYLIYKHDGVTMWASKLYR